MSLKCVPRHPGWWRKIGFDLFRIGWDFHLSVRWLEICWCWFPIFKSCHGQRHYQSGLSLHQSNLFHKYELLFSLNRAKWTFSFSKLTTAVTNSNPDLAEEHNVFLPTFSPESNSSLLRTYEQIFKICNKTRSFLNDDPIRTIRDVYPRAVKRNDTDIHLGSVSFSRLSAEEVLTDEVIYFIYFA